MALISADGIHRPDEAQIAAWRDEFARSHAVRIRGILHPTLLQFAREAGGTARLREYVDPSLPESRDARLNDGLIRAKLFIMLNDARLFDVVRDLSGCDPIGCFWPTIYRMEPAPVHVDDWHDDADGNRLIAMSINIGGAFEGGALHIRDLHSRDVLYRVVNDTDGDGVLFRIAPSLEHMVQDVTGPRPKRALVGWFQRRPHALDMLKTLHAGRESPP